MREILSWIYKYDWKAIWTLSPSHPHTNALTAITVARRVLTLWEGRTGCTLGALLMAEPHPGTRIYHIHGLISADDFSCDEFREFSERWGQSSAQPHRPGGGFIRYITRKLLRDEVEWDL